jgi:hypothetical protein
VTQYKGLLKLALDVMKYNKDKTAYNSLLIELYAVLTDNYCCELARHEDMRDVLRKNKDFMDCLLVIATTHFNAWDLDVIKEDKE